MSPPLLSMLTQKPRSRPLPGASRPQAQSWIELLVRSVPNAWSPFIYCCCTRLLARTCHGPNAASTTCCADRQRLRALWVRMPYRGRNASWPTPHAIGNGCRLTTLGHNCPTPCEDFSCDLTCCSHPFLRQPPLHMISDRSGGVHSSVPTDARLPTLKC